MDVHVPREFDFAAYTGKGLQSNEQLMSGAASGAAAAAPKADDAIVAQLESMGMFTRNACIRAVRSICVEPVRVCTNLNFCSCELRRWL